VVALREQADELRAFRDIATLRPVAVERPADAPLDRAAAAAAARELGMARLADRLEGGGA
jgi:DNA polymerase-1